MQFGQNKQNLSSPIINEIHYYFAELQISFSEIYIFLSRFRLKRKPQIPHEYRWYYAFEDKEKSFLICNMMLFRHLFLFS